MGTLSPAALDFLKSKQEDWDKTPTGDSNELPPDGLYICEVLNFDFFASDKTGHEYLKTELVVIDPADLRGTPISTIHSVTEPDRFRSLKRHLYSLGLEIRDLGDLLTEIGKAKGRHVEVNVTTSKNADAAGNPYRNAYVNNVVSGGVPSSDLPNDVPTAAPVHDDDPAF